MKTRKRCPIHIGASWTDDVVVHRCTCVKKNEKKD